MQFADRLKNVETSAIRELFKLLGKPGGLIVTTGSQQALDLIGKTMISPGDKVIVEAPTFLATIQCFRLYGANIIGAPIDADGVDVDRLEKLIVEHQPKLVY